MNSKFYTKIYLSIILIFSFFIIAMMTYLSKNCCFWGDDYFSATYYGNTEGIIDCLIPGSYANIVHGGGYIGLFLCKFLSFGLPNIFNIHPSDFIGLGHGFIRGVFLLAGILLITKFINFYIKIKSIYLFALFFISGYFFCNAFNSQVINICYSYYRYFFSLLFFCYFWYFIYKNIISRKRKNKLYQIILASFCGYVIGTSSEIVFFTSILITFFLVFYNIVSNIICLININFESKFDSYYFNLNRNFYIPVICLYISTYFFTGSNGWHIVAAERGMSNIIVTYDSLKEFCVQFFDIYIKQNYIHWCLFVLLMFSFFIMFKKRDLKPIIFTVFMQLSLLLVIFSLVLCGKTYKEEFGNYFLVHTNIKFIFKMMIIIPSLLLSSYFIKNKLHLLKTKKSKKIFICLVSLSLLFLTVFEYINFYTEMKNDSFLYEQKRNFYISEKMLRFYYLKNQIAVLPENSQFCINPDFYIKDGKLAPHLYSYYIKIYDKKNVVNNYSYICSEKAFKMFYDAGGKFGEKELKRLKFSTLSDYDLSSDNILPIEKLKEI